MGSYCSRKVDGHGATATVINPASPSKPREEPTQYHAVPTQSSAKSGGFGKCLKRTCCCLVMLLALVVGLYFAAVWKMSEMAVDGFITLHDKDVEEYCHSSLTMANMTENLWWPGCGLVSSMAGFEKCEGTCIKMATMTAMDAFNTQNGGRLVTYFSRPGLDHNNQTLEVVKLTGWWLPAPNHNQDTPRIVLQHGHTSNSNKHRQMFAAYQLRKLGFSVLVNNLRDHCYSMDSTVRLIKWGQSYPSDVLGAWDFAVNDPLGIMGGKVLDTKVGIMGFSMGAFLTTTVFGLEGRVPGVWVDSPPFSPLDGFKQGSLKTLSGMGLPALVADILIPAVWKNVLAAAAAEGVDLNAQTPAKALPLGPDTKRPIYWVGNKDDSTVSFADGAKLSGVLNTYPLKYKLAGKMENQGNCNGGDHCEDHLRIPEQYEAALCSYWNGVFGIVGTCGLPLVAPTAAPAAAATAAPTAVATAAPAPAATAAPTAAPNAAPTVAPAPATAAVTAAPTVAPAPAVATAAPAPVTAAVTVAPTVAPAPAVAPRRLVV